VHAAERHAFGDLKIAKCNRAEGEDVGWHE
jgi:hypothetical protein